MNNNVQHHRSYKILGMLLLYPEADWVAQTKEMRAYLEDEALLSKKQLRQIAQYFDYLEHTDLLELQERYVSLFDRSRSLSMHMFEHVHGESRDRGQAMVDLIDLYHRHGHEVSAQELPDYLPLFLEFLSLLPCTEAQELLTEPKAIIGVLAGRLRALNSPYAEVMDIVATLAQAQIIPAIIPDEDLDAVWEETSVTFLDSEAPKSCGSACTGACGGTGHHQETRG